MSFDVVYPLQTLKPVSSLLRSRVQSDVVESNMTWRDKLEKMFSEKTSEYDQLIEQIGTQLFSKYWNNEEATENSFIDGWLKTGDAAQMDDEGFILSLIHI